MVKLDNEKGTISITSDVFTWLAGDAATRCFGVKGMAGRSKENGVVQLLKRDSVSKGVLVHFDDDGVSIDLHIVVEHGINLITLCNSIRNEVSYKVSSSTGIPVTRVNVFVDSMILA